MHISGSFGRVSVRDILSLAWPMVVGMLSFTVMDFTDTLVAGHLGKTEIAAVGLATTAMLLINSFFLGLFESVKIFVAQSVGAQHEHAAHTAAWQGVFIAVVAGLLVLAIGPYGVIIFELSGAPEKVSLVAQDYFMMRVFGALPWYLALALDNYYQGIGNTKLPMKVNIVACVVNVVLDYAFTYGVADSSGKWIIEPMGVAGIALATVIASVIGMLLVLIVFVRENGFYPVFVRSIMQKMLKVGWPVGVRFLLDIGGWTMFVVIIARMGENELAANQIATKILFLSILPGYGIAETACVFVGQRFGAQDWLGVRTAYASALKISLGVMSVMGLIFLSFPIYLVSVFQSDLEVLRIGSQLITLVAIYQIIDVLGMTTAASLNGKGDTRFVMLVSVLGTWMIMLPLSYFLGVRLGLGAAGVWWGNIVNVSITLMVMTWRFNRNL